jgi:hypothetical protein
LQSLVLEQGEITGISLMTQQGVEGRQALLIVKPKQGLAQDIRAVGVSNPADQGG